MLQVEVKVRGSPGERRRKIRVDGFAVMGIGATGEDKKEQRQKSTLENEGPAMAHRESRRKRALQNDTSSRFVGFAFVLRASMVGFDSVFSR